MGTERTNLSHIVKNFSPAWFAVVLGTGGLANVLFQLSGKVLFLKPIAGGLLWLNAFLYVILIVPWIARWFINLRGVIEDLKHPITINFFVTLPAGQVLLAINFLTIGRAEFNVAFAIGLGLVFWAIAISLALALAVFAMYNLFSMETVSIENINYSWFMSSVASIVIPLLGNILVSYFSSSNLELARFINLVDIVFFGVGILLFFILSSIIFNRFIVNRLPTSTALPTFWILLGPIGVGSAGLMGIADSANLMGLLNSIEAIKFLALVLWGFGLWAFILTLVISIRYLRKGGIAFSLTWWAFIFPTAAYTLASYNIYSYTHIGMVFWYSIALAVLLVFLWLVTFTKTLVGTFSGKIFESPTLKLQGRAGNTSSQLDSTSYDITK